MTRMQTHVTKGVWAMYGRRLFVPPRGLLATDALVRLYDTIKGGGLCASCRLHTC